MRLLLDTHVFIWWDSSPEKLSAEARRLCQDPGNTLVLSVVSVWEMQIKNQLGKLALNRPIPALVQSQQLGNGVEILSVQLAHIYALDTLPSHHRDPFDRLLIAQAQSEGLTLLSMDPVIRQYPIVVLG